MEMTRIDPWSNISKLKGYSPEFIAQVREAQRRKLAEQVAEQERKQAADKMHLRSVPKWVADIIFETAKEHGASPFDIVGESRKYRDVDCRAEAIYRIKDKRPSLSSPRIAKWFGKDHTSILYALSYHSRRTGLPRLSNYVMRPRKGILKGGNPRSTTEASS